VFECGLALGILEEKRPPKVCNKNQIKLSTAVQNNRFYESYDSIVVRGVE
jgi:hypothetical protein